MIVGVGVAVALAMGWLGLWQMQVFESQGQDSAAARAALPALRLSEVKAAGLPAAFGRTVIADGGYLKGQDRLVISSDGTARVLSAMRLKDGRVLAVVRGMLPGYGSTPAPKVRIPDPPPGELLQQGVLLPSETAQEARDGLLGSVNLPQLVQEWPTPLIDGFLTIGPSDAALQGLLPAEAKLPGGQGSARNAGYALQWWVFGGFALIMSVVIARGGRLPGASSDEE